MANSKKLFLSGFAVAGVVAAGIAIAAPTASASEHTGRVAVQSSAHNGANVQPAATDAASATLGAPFWAYGDCLGPIPPAV